MLSFFHIPLTLPFLVILLFGANASADDKEVLDNDENFEKYIAEWMQSLCNSNECGKDPNKPVKDERWQMDGSLLSLEVSCTKYKEQCPDGHHRDGETCKDIDECKNGPHNCSQNANCTNTDGAFNCTCLDGYHGDGVTCKDIDECKDGTHNCSQNGNCTNTDGAFNCTCLDGYPGDGVRCKDIDECQNGTHNCSLIAKCTNTNGSFSCTCFDGFCGNGVKCIVSKNCTEVLKCGGKKSGVYTVDPDGMGPFKVYCDQKTSDGGWTVFQKRQDGSINFYRGWTDYKTGFGNLTGEFWLGLDKIYRLTNKKQNRLRVELEDTIGISAYAEYDYFAVSSENDKYRLSLGTYSGNAGDSLGWHRGAPFTTKDSDNDSSGNNCAVRFKGAWWYTACHHSNLNGLYHHGAHSSRADGVNWYHWKGHYYSAKRAEMKIRPVGFKTG